MTPRPRETGHARGKAGTRHSISDDDSVGEDHECERAHRSWRNRLRDGFRQLVRLEPYCDGQPRAGEYCIIMTGKAGQDLGQMGRVTDVKPVMVEVAYRGPEEGPIVYKNKRPSSLIMLEDGLEVIQTREGIIRIQRRRRKKNDEERL
jgi:hypothetical protein